MTDPINKVEYTIEAITDVQIRINITMPVNPYGIVLSLCTQKYNKFFQITKKHSKTLREKVNFFIFEGY